jgi:hypothetical protein
MLAEHVELFDISPKWFRRYIIIGHESKEDSLKWEYTSPNDLICPSVCSNYGICCFQILS